MVSNFLPPDSQPWARSLESRLSSLESTTSSLKKSAPSRLPSAVSTPDNRLTISTPPVPGEGSLHGSLEHLDGVYTLRYGHEFHGITQYYLEIKGEHTDGGTLVVTGPDGVILHETELEVDPDIEDPADFTILVEFPIPTYNYDLDADEDMDLPDVSQDVVSEFVLPDTGTITLATPATLSDLSFEIRSLNRSEIMIDTSSGQPEITGVSALGGETRVLESFSTVLDEAIEAINTARQELSDADDILASNLTDLETRLSDDIAEATVAIGGKNSVTISAHEPGTPGAVAGDVWWRIDTYDRVYGQWTWDGSNWEPSTIRNELVASLDVHKLQVTGDAKIAEAVINKLYSELIVTKLLTAERVIAEHMLATGSVTARTLNVVPEDGQGGTVLTGTEIGVVGSDGESMVSLSADQENFLTFYDGGRVMFSASDTGDVTTQTVSANDGLFYRGVELTELLEAMPRGVIYFAEKINDIHTISNASYTSRIGHISVDRPSTARHWRIVARAGIASSSSGGNDTSGAHWQFVSNGGRVYNQSTWTVLASVLYQTSGYYWQTETLDHVVNTDDIEWSSTGQALISWTARNASGSSYKLGQGAYFYIEDVGPAFDPSPTYPWIRPDASSDTGSSTTPTARTSTWNMSSFQNFRSGVRLAHTSGNIAGGNYSGEWRGIMFFPHATIKSALSGATISKVEVYLQNAHTYASSGSTVLVGTHNYASAPSSSPAVAARASQHFARGQGRWVTLPTAVGTGFANGTIKGIAVYGGSTANYATWTPSAPKLRITYKK